ncbi:hypothetical protein [uncultured Brachyspira sp.]|nr:hypothetical protein [uncultured Brachyspira sp.]
MNKDNITLVKSPAKDPYMGPKTTALNIVPTLYIKIKHIFKDAAM